MDNGYRPTKDGVRSGRWLSLCEVSSVRVERNCMTIYLYQLIFSENFYTLRLFFQNGADHLNSIEGRHQLIKNNLIILYLSYFTLLVIIKLFLLFFDKFRKSFTVDHDLRCNQKEIFGH